jgi:hypothetical protein
MGVSRVTGDFGPTQQEGTATPPVSYAGQSWFDSRCCDSAGALVWPNADAGNFSCYVWVVTEWTGPPRIVSNEHDDMKWWSLERNE